jgi:hypothetical protein
MAHESSSTTSTIMTNGCPAIDAQRAIWFLFILARPIVDDGATMKKHKHIMAVLAISSLLLTL